MKTPGQWTAEEHRAIGLYAVLARDACDFIDMVQEEQRPEVLRILYEMLTTPNPDMSSRDKELNEIGARLIESILRGRGIDTGKRSIDPNDESMFKLED